MSDAIYQENDHVRWRWGDGWAYGRVKQRYTAKVGKSIKGTEVARNADRDNPAYLIEQSDGGRVLKSHDELQQAG